MEKDGFFIKMDKIAYLKLHKCGSTSVLDYLKNKGEVVGTKYSWTPDRPVFTIVRNPYSRLVSCWANRVNGGWGEWNNTFKGDKSKKMGITKNMNFHDFAHTICDINDANSDAHFASMSYLIDYFIDGDLELFLKLENLNQEKDVLMNYGLELNIPHCKKSTHRKWQSYYEMNPNLKNLIYKRYKKDFERFNYDKLW